MKGITLDEIEKAFAEISVADFERKTSAVSEVAARLPHKLADFNTFVDELVATSRESAASPGEFQPVAVLCSADLVRTFIPDADETVLDFASRLQREADEMGAQWFFTAILSCGRAYNSDEEPTPIDADNPEELQAALERGEVEIAICWYAEMHHPTESCHRAGIIGFVDGSPGEGIEGDIDADKNPFHYVLNG